MSEKRGWIKVYRKLQECELWLEDKPFDDRSAWIDLLISAGHRDTRIIFNGHPVTVARGQLLTSVRKLAVKWKWGNQKTLNYLRMLEELGMIKKDSDNYRTLITIENYEIYQGDENTDRTLIDTPSEQKPTTNKKTKNEKKEISSRSNELLLIEQSNLSLPLKAKVDEWICYKKERREGYKETGLKSLLTQISKKEAEAGSQAVIDVIDLSMSNGWKGIIWDRMGKPSKAETKFHNFNMKHNYDFDEMEKRLLE